MVPSFSCFFSLGVEEMNDGKKDRIGKKLTRLGSGTRMNLKEDG